MGPGPLKISSKQVVGTDLSEIESLQPVKIANPVLNQIVGMGIHPISVYCLYFISNWKLLTKDRRVLARSSMGLPHNIHVQVKQTTPTYLPTRPGKSHPSRTQRALSKRGNHGVDHTHNSGLLLKLISY